MMEANFKLAQRLQTKEQGEITIEERSRLFIELMNKRKKHFAMLRDEEKRRKPPTKFQNRNHMSTYLKNIGGYKHNQGKMFDNEMRRVNTFIPMDSKKVVRRKLKVAERRCLVGKEQQQESSKRQRTEDDKVTDEHEEVEEDDEAKLKKHLVIVKDDEIAIDAIPLATKPPMIIEYKLLKEGIMVHFQLIRTDGSSKRYSLIIMMLQDIDREDLETLWKLVKTKHGDIRPEDEHEIVLLGDLKVMFEPDIRSEVWRNLQGYTMKVWKLYDSCGVHFERIRINKWYQSFALRNIDIKDMELAIDGVGFDWSDMAEEQCNDLIIKLNQTEFTVARYKRGLAIVEEQLITYRKNEVLFSEEVAVLKKEVACKDYEINVLKSEFEKVKQEKEGIEFKILKFDKASKDLDQLLEKPEFKRYGPENSKQESNIVCDKKSDNSKEKSDNSLVKEQVSKDTSSFVESSLNVDKETVFLVDKKAESVKPKNHEKPVKKSGKPQQDDTGFVDSGCSRHMTGNIAYLSDFKEFDGGYVSLVN
ncbi:hypothetical protein Tco_0222940 [Tanacetum coccineum]